VSDQAADRWSIVERAVELARLGEEFVMATVVWRQGPSSGQHGSRAIVTASGELHGFIGGACAEPVLVREAQRALVDRTPRLLVLGQSDQLGHVPEGMTAIAISCQSEGALQIYLEPVQATPHLVVVGRSPMAHTLEQLAGALDWNVERVDGPDFDASSVGRRTMVVVATQGHGDEDVVEAAVAARPVFLGVVASRKRGDALRTYLHDRGVADELVDRLRVPVGLDLGHTSHREVAVSVLAELVQLRAAGALVPEPGEATFTAPPEAIDPVCGMTVRADASGRPFEHDGTTYYFCCPGCRYAFANDPAAFLGEAVAAVATDLGTTIPIGRTHAHHD
jgi:xanthine dehydrogenase accessory factor